MAEEAVETQNTEVIEDVNPFETRPVSEKKETVGADEDVVIKEKDTHIKEKPPVTKTNEPEKIPTATPKDIPARTEEEKTDIKPASEFKFANETSERLFNLLKEGKEDDVYEFLSKKKTLSNLDKMPAADLVKLAIKNENKDYTNEDVQDVFSEKYSVPEAPEQRLEETDEEFSAREEKYKEQVAKVERRIERDAKASKAELQKLSQELVLPDIPKSETTAKQPTQEELERQEAARKDYLNSIDEGLNNFKSIDATFKDKEVEIPVAYKLSADERKELKETMENFNLEDFIKERWLTKDGKFNSQQQAKDIFLLTKGDVAIAKLVDQVGNKRYAEAIKSQKNVDFSGQSRSGNLQPSATEEMEKMAQHFYSN